MSRVDKRLSGAQAYPPGALTPTTVGGYIRAAARIFIHPTLKTPRYFRRGLCGETCP